MVLKWLEQRREHRRMAEEESQRRAQSQRIEQLIGILRNKSGSFLDPNKDRTEKVQAMEELAKTGDDRALAPLVEVLTNEHHLSGWWWLRRDAGDAVFKLGCPLDDSTRASWRYSGGWDTARPNLM